jgi:hypothetical protein
MSLQTFASEFLTFLEKREERLLSWGFYNVRWTPADIEAAFAADAPSDLQNAWQELAAEGRTLRSVIQQMQQRNLLYAVPDTLDSYRTRFAEGVRLLANLRQMFKDSDWATGPRLVSDIKLHLAPRQYPRRDQTAASVWERLRPLCPRSQAALIERCFFALATQGGVPLSFAGFQVRAFEHIISRYASSGLTGSVICAGTGSGKTKAFYIPAFLRIAPELDQPPFTKLIAIYPRNVLLADQLREAIAEAEKLRPVLLESGLRPIRFGALLGYTPYRRWFESAEPKKYHWERRGDAAVIPYLKSPTDGGRSDLLWRDEDRLAGRTCLYRERAAQPDLPADVLALTREELIQRPPDVLFLSLEMLNREMCNPQWQTVFGMRRGPDRSPRLLLLDEVHAHEGLAGAQAAWVLRRWRHWARVSSLHVTGLSATLRDAPQHLATLAGLLPSLVQEFRPRTAPACDSELESEGIEYNLAVKGDPAAGASLLATSIQAGMLLGRLLTPRRLGPSGPGVELRPEEFFRSKVFGFSDNLDSVNRWFSDMSDAENRLRLASLRRQPAPGTQDNIRRRRFQEGQVWELPARLGHDLAQPLTVTRCSSQDPGADPNSDLIIATSSLEVGFDDPEVAIILHHKSPGSMSSFIQRKGRAGRTRRSRPWTTVVLSDYGADRWAFHSAEHLFQPEVDALILPALNPYVLRVQLAHYLIDWIGRRLGGNLSAYRYLAGPDSFPPTPELQTRATQLLRGLLEQGQTWRDFDRDISQFFRYATGLEEDAAREQLNGILWHEPRPLMMEVIPALLRKLEATWRYTYPPPGATVEDAGSNRPLPQFVPKATFAELDLGEAVLELDPYRGRRREPETMPISRLLLEACPGRVSKRFATTPGEPGYWHPHSANLQPGQNLVSVAELFPHHIFLEAVNGVAVLEPHAAAVAHRALQYNDTSNSLWQWQTRALVQGEGEPLPVREDSPWRDVFSSAQAYLHSNAEWVELLRYAEGCRFDIRRNKQSITGTLRLRRDVGGGASEPQAVGFRLCADGIRFVLRPDHLASRPQLSAETLNRFRADYFRYRLATSAELSAAINPFQADWLAETSLAMLTATASAQRGTLAAAQDRLENRRPEAAARVLDVIFQLRGVTAAGDEEHGRLRQTLLDLWGNPAVRGQILALEQVLWAQPDATFAAWVRQRYAATLAQAIRVAMVSMAPQVNEDDLTVDVLLRVDGGYDLIVAEPSPGGLGQIETIVREIQRQPRRFLDGLEFALAYCPRERSAANLLAIAQAASAERRTGGHLSAAFAQARAASGFSDLEAAKDQLQAALLTRGFSAVRSLVVSVATKLLRPASDARSDRLITSLDCAWRRRSHRLNIAVPARTFAYICAHHPRISRVLSAYIESIGGEPPTAPQLFAQIQQLVLETCTDSCPECLNQKGRFYDLGLPSRALTREWLDMEIQTIFLAANPQGWQDDARQILQDHGRVRLSAGPAQSAALAQALPALCVAELNLQALRASVCIGRVEQVADTLSVVLHIPDFVHG